MPLLTKPNPPIMAPVVTNKISFPSDTNCCLHVGQINIRHCAAATSEISALFTDGDFSIIAIQECYNLNGAPYGFPEDVRLVYSGSNPSVCFLIDLKLSFTLIAEFSSTHIVIIESLLNNSPFF